MIAFLPLKFAAADALYAAGLGFMLAIIYTCVRMLLPNKSIFIFICDLAIICLATLLYDSIAIARFYSGIARWYTILAMILGYSAWQLSAHSKLVFAAKVIKQIILLPFIKLWSDLLKPTFVKIYTFVLLKHKKHHQKHKTKLKKHANLLQKPSHMLYNSK